jgi:lysophospholipase L1-like esterase
VKRLARGAIPILIAFAILGVAELALRLAGFQEPRAVIVGPGDELHRFNPAWLWEPRPGSPADQCGGVINADGYRGPLRPRHRSPRTLRIVTLGDSSTFGIKVCEPKTYPALLERDLPGSEVLNFGVIGFSALQGLELLKGRILDYEPQVVVAAFGAVNEGTPAFDGDVETRMARAAGVNLTFALVRDRLRDLRLMQLAERWVLPPLRKQPVIRPGVPISDSDGPPNESVEGFVHALEGIVETSRAHGAMPVLVAPPRIRRFEEAAPWLLAYDDALRSFATRANVPLADVHTAFRQDPRDDDALLMDAVHPRPPGYVLYAQVVANAIRASPLATGKRP